MILAELISDEPLGISQSKIYVRDSRVMLKQEPSELEGKLYPVEITGRKMSTV